MKRMNVLVAVAALLSSVAMASAANAGGGYQPPHIPKPTAAAPTYKLQSTNNSLVFGSNAMHEAVNEHTDYSSIGNSVTGAAAAATFETPDCGCLKGLTVDGKSVNNGIVVGKQSIGTAWNNGGKGNSISNSVTGAVAAVTATVKKSY